jgi:hypothetical protein
MTREEAIKWLSNLKNDLGQMQYQPLWHYAEAIDGIIEALKGESIFTADRPRGHWIDMADFEQCSECGGTHLKEVDTYYGKAIWIKTDFCPNCGADMRGEDDDNIKP